MIVNRLDYYFNLVLVFFLWFHILSSSFSFKRYFFEIDRLSKFQAIYLSCLILLLPIATFLVFGSTSLSLIGYLIFFLFLRFIHIDRRYKSLSRGAGAVGIVPLQILFFLCLERICNIFNFESSNYIFSLFILSQGIMMFEAGINKYLFGYAQTRSPGLFPALINPCWSRHYQFFQGCSDNLFKFINKSAFILQILCGLMLIMPNNYTRVIGLILILH